MALCHAQRIRLRRSHKVGFLQVRAMRKSGTVALGLAQPGVVVTSGVIGFRTSQLRDDGATLTFAGSRQGVTRTLPLEIYVERESDANAAVALSLLLVAVAAVVVVGVGSRRLR